MVHIRSFISLALQLRIRWPVRGGAEKHESYAAAFGGHLFNDLFLQGLEGHGPLDPLLCIRSIIYIKFIGCIILKKSELQPSRESNCLVG